jgi:hypothetical protein
LLCSSASIARFKGICDSTEFMAKTMAVALVRFGRNAARFFALTDNLPPGTNSGSLEEGFAVP